jgi:hypothetical protein
VLQYSHDDHTGNHMVTKRLASPPILVHVPDWKVRSITINAEQPDVLHVVAEDMSKSSQPDILPVEKWGAEDLTAPIGDFLLHAGRCDSSSRVLTDEALEDFATASKLGVGAFVTKYGLFKRDYSDTFDLPNLKGDGRLIKFRVSESEYKREQDFMRDVLRLYGLIKAGDQQRARGLSAKMALPYSDDPERALSLAIGAKIGGQTLFSLERLNQVVLKCVDVLSGLHATLWGTFITKHYWSACPTCGVVFQASEKKIFHDMRCGRIYKQRRWREKQKKKNLQTSQKGKKRRISR